MCHAAVECPAAAHSGMLCGLWRQVINVQPVNAAIIVSNDFVSRSHGGAATTDVFHATCVSRCSYAGGRHIQSRSAELVAQCAQDCAGSACVL